MLIDQFMPRWDVRERHQIRVHATAEQLYATLRTADLGAHPVVRGMLALRALPAALLERSRLLRLRHRASQPITLATFEEHGFRVLAEAPPHELLIGLEGSFWKPGGDLRPVDAASFRTPVPPGTARAVWNFEIALVTQRACILRTETRVLAGDASARRRFRLYWALVRPGSGIIRRLMLRAIRDAAEQAPGAGTSP